MIAPIIWRFTATVCHVDKIYPQFYACQSCWACHGMLHQAIFQLSWIFILYIISESATDTALKAWWWHSCRSPGMEDRSPLFWLTGLPAILFTFRVVCIIIKIKNMQAPHIWRQNFQIFGKVENPLISAIRAKYLLASLGPENKALFL